VDISERRDVLLSKCRVEVGGLLYSDSAKLTRFDGVHFELAPFLAVSRTGPASVHALFNGAVVKFDKFSEVVRLYQRPFYSSVLFPPVQ